VLFDYPADVSFVCSKCGLCCGDTSEKVRHVLLLKADAEKISTLTNLPIGELAHEIEGKEPYVYEMNKKIENGKCIFLESNQCKLYAYRPLICRFYPFELSTGEDGKFVFRVTSECPSVRYMGKFGVDKKLDVNFFRVLLDLARKELDPALM
jgi:Fe-S-cluster containining protein